MERKAYRAPTVRVLGTVAEMTGENGGTAHVNGSD
jgi:hypothetical protein